MVPTLAAECPQSHTGLRREEHLRTRAARPRGRHGENAPGRCAQRKPQTSGRGLHTHPVWETCPGLVTVLPGLPATASMASILSPQTVQAAVFSPPSCPFCTSPPAALRQAVAPAMGTGPPETRAREDQEPCSKRTVTLSLLFCHNAQRGHRTFVRTGWL